MTIEISYDGETFAYPNLCLTELPFAFDGQNVRRGRTAEMLKITGLLLQDDVESIVDIYRNWRDEKITEEDPQKTGVVGTTITVSGDGVGFAWVDRPCWFNKAPEITYAGIYGKVSIEIVDAEQALEILMEEKEDEEEDGIDRGTLTLGGAIINLTAYPNSYEGLPKTTRNPAGAHIISGSLSLEQVKEVEGWVTASDLVLLESWLNTSVSTTPDPDDWFPINWSKPTDENRKVGLTYNIKLQLIKIIG